MCKAGGRESRNALNEDDTQGNQEGGTRANVYQMVLKLVCFLIFSEYRVSLATKYMLVNTFIGSFQVFRI